MNEVIPIAIVTGTWLCCALASASPPAAGAITYQGQLDEAGEPAAGPVDLRFTLYDAASNGRPVGGVVEHLSVELGEGRFTVVLDFGADVFNGSDRWIEIEVAAAGSGQWVTLDPRQKVTPAPVALFALEGNAGPQGPPGADALWDVAGSTMYYNDGFVGVGRSTAITGSDVFGIHNPVGSGAYGGMYASTEEGGRPFYGYNTAGETGWHYLEGTTGDWHLNLDGNRLTVTDEGNVGIGTDTPAFALQIDTDSSRAISAVTSSSIGSTMGLFAYASARTGNNTFGVYGASSSTTGRGLFGRVDANTGRNYGVYGQSDSATGYDFYAAGAGINYGSGSSRRWKNNIEVIDDPLDKLAQLRGVYFDWNKEHGGHHDIGMIAEEVGAVLPEIVNYEENGIDAHGMDYSKLTPLLVEAVNRLRAEKDAEINELRQRVVELERIVEQLASPKHAGIAQ